MPFSNHDCKMASVSSWWRLCVRYTVLLRESVFFCHVALARTL